MSSSTSIADALSSSIRPADGRCWRFVEAQHYVSTAKLTDTETEQRRLETLIEETKPSIPAECRELNFLLATPFRYGAPYPSGSRFRRAGLTLGVFYASQREETAAAEMATTPTSLRVSPYSRRMRPRIGTAVMASPTPQNRL